MPQPQTQGRAWLVQIRPGELRLVRDFSEVIRLILERRVDRTAQIYEIAGDPRSLGEIPELANLFGDDRAALRPADERALRPSEEVPYLDSISPLGSTDEAFGDDFYDVPARNRGPRWLAAGLAVAALAGGGYWALHHYGHADPGGLLARVSGSAPSATVASTPPSASQPTGAPAPSAAAEPAKAAEAPVPALAEAPKPAAAAAAAPGLPETPKPAAAAPAVAEVPKPAAAAPAVAEVPKSAPATSAPAVAEAAKAAPEAAKPASTETTALALAELTKSTAGKPAAAARSAPAPKHAAAPKAAPPPPQKHALAQAPEKKSAGPDPLAPPRGYDDLVREGDRLMTSGHSKKAAQLFEQAMAIQPDGAAALNGMAYAWLDRGDPNKAIPLFQRAFWKDAHLSSALFGLGEAYRALGRRKEAADAFRVYLLRFPNARDAKAAHKQIDLINRELGATASGT